MCGVAGIYAYHYASNPVDRDELVRTRDHQRARGPDAEGLWIAADGRVGLGHRRLSIIDLSAAANQPMLSGDGSLAISFNGEIYNYKALKRQLEEKGIRFRTNSDTEVLLHLYRARGEKMFAELRGMYAFALWDANKKALLLARDPYGIKPLYYADDGWTCRVGSQVKALLAGGGVSRVRDPAGLVGFYLLGSVPEPFTLYQDIRAVPAGSYVWVTPLGVSAPVPHFSIARTWASVSVPADAAETIQSALLDSVRHHLVADVPVGAFLSSGIDSGALVGLMRDAGQEQIKTVTVAFDEFKGTAEDEAPLAAETAKVYGTQHHEYRVTQAEFRNDLPRVLDAMDQPTIDGVNTWFVAKATAAQGLKVAISGLGGDELFGGYDSFRDVPRWVHALAVPSRVPGLKQAFRLAAKALLPRANPKISGLLEFGGSYAGAWFLRRGLFMPWDLVGLVDADTAREGLRRLRLEERIAAMLEPDPGSAFARVSTLESALYMRNQLLRDTDWASMAHSLEVRVPFVDPVLLRAAARVASGRQALDKKRVAEAPRVQLPRAVGDRDKTGFMTPVGQWLLRQQALDAWRSVPQLTRSECPWARRWSHVVGVRFAQAA